MSAELKECGTLFICFLDLPEIRHNCAKIHHCRICATDFMPPSVSSPERSHLDRVKDGVIFTGKHRQSWKNISGKIEKSSKIRQDKKSLISTCACFFNCYCQSLVSEGETGRWVTSPYSRFFYYLLIS